MLRSFKIGKVFGIPLYIHPTFLLLPLWVQLQSQGGDLASMLFSQALLFAVFACVVLHELGHALMARYYGIPTRDITLYPIGGVARLERMSEKPLQELAIALAGPAVNLVIFLALGPISLLALVMGLVKINPEAATIAYNGWPGMAAMFALTLALCNLMLLVFNLLPAFPMDGGRVFRALLALGMKRLRATEIAAGVGIVVAALIATSPFYMPALLGRPESAGFNPMPLLLGLFVCFAGQMELVALRRREAQRQAGAALAAPAPRIIEPIAAPLDPEFTGFRWDSNYHAWVWWYKGRPVLNPPGNSAE